MDLDHIVYLAGFEDIEIGLSASGEWGAYLRRPCRYLDSETFACSVHGTPAQPSVCVHYNPYSCWYRRVLTVDPHADFVRITAPRLDWLLERVLFDDERTIVEVPAWEEILPAFEGMPIDSPSVEFGKPALADPAFEAWLSEPARRDGQQERRANPLSLDDRENPCSGCGAYCCETLTFPISAPFTASSLDFLRFALGFPGVEIGIADSEWSLVVKTSCRHLENRRCSLYGDVRRPLICTYYDELKCSYRTEFGIPGPEGFLRIRLEQYPFLVEALAYDDLGRLTELPAVATLRSHIERRLDMLP